jgi:hypothetical protein
VYDIAEKQVHLFERGHRKKKVHANVLALSDPDIADIIGEPSCAFYWTFDISDATHAYS